MLYIYRAHRRRLISRMQDYVEQGNGFFSVTDPDPHFLGPGIRSRIFWALGSGAAFLWAPGSGAAFFGPLDPDPVFFGLVSRCGFFLIGLTRIKCGSGLGEIEKRHEYHNIRPINYFSTIFYNLLFSGPNPYFFLFFSKVEFDFLRNRITLSCIPR